MPYLFNHVHLKSPNPAEAANWYVKTFNFKIISDTDNFFGRGDKFIKCETEDGIVVNISGPQPGELLGDGDSSAHYGLEHFGIQVEDMQSEILRLESMGVNVLSDIISLGSNIEIAFIEGPDRVRIELLEIKT
ncbi:MAG: VOC family protein [Dehalococcoidia bacterium]